MTVRKPIYMDHNATTPVDRRVVEAMAPLWTEHFGNAASHTHAYGWAAARFAEKARATLAAAVGAQPEEIIFTSGATEANNLALKGLAWALHPHHAHLVTCATEHKAVLDPCHALARAGFTVTVLPVDRDGRLDPARLREALTPQTAVVSVMRANNETGTLQPVREVAAVCRERGVLIHCDATQAVGKIPVNVDELGVDLMSFSAHKVYGPKGVGALYLRHRKPRIRLVPLLDGGGHERGVRSGTLDVPGVVGFARATEIAVAELAAESARLAALRDRLQEAIRTRLDGVTVNGHPSQRLPNTLNASFHGVDGAALLVGLDEVAVASGSACTSADPAPSHVLIAMGRSKTLAGASIRFSLGRSNTSAEVDTVAAAVIREVTRLRTQARAGRGS
jgi:cysteine desulfurase